MMHLRGFVLLVLSSMLANGLETSAHEARVGLVPGGLPTGVFRRTGPAAEAWRQFFLLRNEEAVQSFRFGPRRTSVIVSAEKAKDPKTTFQASMSMASLTKGGLQKNEQVFTRQGM